MKFRYLTLVLCAFPVMGSAQDRAAVSGPVSGFVFDQKVQALRPVVGVPGAAYVGSAALAGYGMAAVAPDGSAALAVKEGKVVLIAGLKAEPAEIAVDGAIDGIDRIAWAADSTAAAVYASASGAGQVLRNLNGTPAAGDAMDLSALPGAVTALACAADGILAGVADEAAGGVYFVKAGSPAALLAGAARPSGISVAGADAFFADQERGQVWQVAGFAQDAAVMLFADGLAAPVGVQVSGRRLFVANSGDSTLGIFELETRAAVASLALDAAPATLEAFGGRGLWLLNHASEAGDPVYVLDGRENPAVYFVPAGREQ